MEKIGKQIPLNLQVQAGSSVQSLLLLYLNIWSRLLNVSGMNLFKGNLPKNPCCFTCRSSEVEARTSYSSSVLQRVEDERKVEII